VQAGTKGGGGAISDGAQRQQQQQQTIARKEVQLEGIERELASIERRAVADCAKYAKEVAAEVESLCKKQVELEMQASSEKLSHLYKVISLLQPTVC
jgi:hypothetical protein